MKRVLLGAIAFVILAAIFAQGDDDKPTPKRNPAQEVAPSTSASATMDPKTDVMAAAYATCKVIQSSGYAPECEVSGWNGTVDAVIDTSSSEARKICAGMVELVAEQTRAFSSAGRTWQLRIFSPYSGDHPLAVCDLR